MITGEIKNKVDRMWEYFWTGGLTNPVDVIEQLTYLIFMKRLDQEEERKEREKNEIGSIFGNIEEKFIFSSDEQDIRWNKLILLGDPKELFNKVKDRAFEFIKNLDEDKESVFSQYMKNAIFKVPTPAVLQNTMDTIEEIFNNPEMVEDKDTKGDLYEYLLSKLSTSGKNGQFRTPKHIINMMVELMKPRTDDKIIDPACGTSGFLVSSIEYIKRNYREELATTPEVYEYFTNEMIHGNDTDATMLGISAMNLLLHDIKTPKLKRIDSLSSDYHEESKYTLILANPPFKGSVDESLLANSLTSMVKTKKTELLFISLFLRLLKIGGRAAIIVPDGVLFGSSNAHKNLRKELIEKNQLEGVISMPSGVFKPYAGVSTAILIFTKTGNGGTDNVWFYDMTADGYSLDDKRNPIEENDIPDIIERFSNLENEKDRKRTDKSFFVPKQEIVDNEYDLSINKYKEIVYEKVEYEKPEIILQKLEELSKSIDEKLKELKVMLDEE
nr:class I SAM-dependent DNA methyltransferase [uncultured Fusobacterium sp.]